MLKTVIVWMLKHGVSPMILGAMGVLAFAPFDWKWMLFISVGGLFYTCLSCGKRASLFTGWSYGFGFFLSAFHWVYLSSHVYGGANLAAGILAPTCLAAFLGLYTGFAAFSARICVSRREQPSGLFAVAFALCWLFAELLRGWVLTGFPWLSAGYMATDTPWQHLAPVVGAHAISFVLVLMACLIASALWQKPALGRLAVYVGLSAAFTFACTLLNINHTQPKGEPQTVALVQGNISQAEKWQPAMRQESLRRYQSMTQTAWDAGLVIWPEVALTYPYHYLKDTVLADLDKQAKAQNAALVTGMVFKEGDTVLNGVIALGTSKGRYYKRHLVPFGEYFPVPDWVVPFLDFLDVPFSVITIGEGEQEFITARGQTLGMNICFEDVFGAEFARRFGEADVLINVTNDAWFVHPDWLVNTAPHQHLQIARMRAIETQRYLLRNTQNGISAIINPQGDIEAELGQFKQGVLRSEYQAYSGTTPYAKFGDVWLWCASILGLIIFAVRRWVKRIR